jgi:ketosteroid isomerase-like protein
VRTPRLAVLALALGGAWAGSAAAGPDADPTATPRAFIADVLGGDADAAAALMTADASIIDEVPPFAWNGQGACRRWLADYAAASRAAQDTNANVKLGDPIVATSDGDAAYVVFHAAETYKERGVRMAETARMTFALRREGGAWKIAAWAWAGRKPHTAAKADRP